MARIFLTGATGYVGGEALYRVAKHAGSKHQISALVRDVAKASIVQSSYPNVRIIHADLNDVEAIKHEVKNADVVFHLASTKHENSSNAIAAAFNDPSRTKPGFWIQISGASVFSGPDIKSGRYGEPPQKVYDDLQDGREILKIINDQPTRVVDNLIVSQNPSKVRTALVIGPLIYGIGSGPVNKRSVQAPEIARLTLEHEHGFQLGRGLTTWSNIHVHDLGNLFVALLDAAVGDEPKNEGVWNHDGIYTPENGKLTFGELSRLIASEAHRQGHISSATVDWTISPEEANSFSPHSAVLWGTNAITKSSRERSNLGWAPLAPPLEATVQDVVHTEVRRRA